MGHRHAPTLSNVRSPRRRAGLSSLRASAPGAAPQSTFHEYRHEDPYRAFLRRPNPRRAPTSSPSPAGRGNCVASPSAMRYTSFDWRTVVPASTGTVGSLRRGSSRSGPSGTRSRPAHRARPHSGPVTRGSDRPASASVPKGRPRFGERSGTPRTPSRPPPLPTATPVTSGRGSAPVPSTADRDPAPRPAASPRSRLPAPGRGHLPHRLHQRSPAVTSDCTRHVRGADGPIRRPVASQRARHRTEPLGPGRRARRLPPRCTALPQRNLRRVQAVARVPFRLRVCDALRLPDRVPSRHQLVDHLRAKRFGECGVGPATAPVDDDPPTIVRPLWGTCTGDAVGVTDLSPGSAGR